MQTSQTGGQKYNDTSPFSNPWVGVFASGNYFQPSLMFDSNAGTYMMEPH